uniref:OX-2 membrane glycoprotein-like n=1 Tax=Scatophagus argus TaxID=75038 RepID=UPI001ED810DD|nr:OX-2 membrane glycoprotein-like [Scatophagus argus]
MLRVLILLSGLLFKASPSQITGHGDVSADYGGDAHYRCAAHNLTGVLQVTWQRHFKDDSIENLVTYSKRFGQQINEPYQGKVIFTEASLSSTAITLKNVTWEDDSCYICSFNVYPDGSKRKQTCLTVQGISEVETGVQPASSEGENTEKLVFSCSATGKPTPTIKWVLSTDVSLLSQTQTTAAENSDHTFTSSSNITVQVQPGWTGHVVCQLNSGTRGERQEEIHYAPSLDKPNKEEEGKSLSSIGLALVICAVFLISCIAVAAAVKRKRLKDVRRGENV